jgi:hypothetical protein
LPPFGAGVVSGVAGGWCRGVSDVVVAGWGLDPRGERGRVSVIMLSVMITESGCRISRLRFRGNRVFMIAETRHHLRLGLMSSGLPPLRRTER